MRKSHFTLIELLIVIAVIVILMGIAIAVSGPMMAKAENNACASMIQKILGACEKFKNDFGAYPGELSALKTRDTERQQPRYTTSEATYTNNNDLPRYLFKRIPGQGSDQGATTKGTVTSWHGDYLDSGDIGEQYIASASGSFVILDYWQEKPLVYWLRYKDGNASTTSELKKKLTPELWSIGGDGDATAGCLKLYAYPDLKKCRGNHSKDEDNVGGDLNSMKK